MDLMNKFELSYELPDENGYLIPELLPKSEPPEFSWNEKDDLCFYYCYDYFLPLGIIPRFIVRMHPNLKKKKNGLPLCWREGAVVKIQNSLALIKMKPDEKQIEIRIKGNSKREARAAICYELDQINASIKKISVSKQIPCNCSENCPKKYSYEELLNAEMNNIRAIPCLWSCKLVPISLLLDGYMRSEERLEEYEEISKKLGQTIIVNPTFNPIFNQSAEATSEANQVMKAEQKTEVKTDITLDISIDLKIDLPQIQAEFADLRREVEDLDPKLKEEMDKIQDNLDDVSSNSEKEKLNKPLNKLGRFLKELDNPNSNYSKVIKGTEKGIEYAQKLGRTYNKFAQWLAMPQVPDLFLGK